MRYTVLVLLSGQQYLAVSFLYAAMPAVLRANGAPLELIGWFGMVFMAFTLNVLWAPLVDRHGWHRLGLRRSWVLAMQISAASVLALMALLSPQTNPLALLACSLLLATIAATQRIATLGYASETLDAAARAPGAAAMGWGMSLGNAIGGGTGLWLIDSYGWTPTLFAAAGLMAALSGSVLLMREPVHSPQPRSLASALYGTLRRPRLWQAMAMTAPATFGVAIAFAMTAPWLIDLGLNLSQVGLAMALCTVAAFSTAGPLSGLAMRRMAPARGVLLGAAILGPALLALFLAADLVHARTWGLCAVLAVFCALAIQNVSFNAYFYSLARPGEAATDVTLLTAFMSLVAMAGFAASGYVAQAWGYASTLLCAAAGYGCTALLARLLARQSVDQEA